MRDSIHAVGKSVLVVGVTALLSACGSDSVVSSSGIPTGQIEATIAVYSDGGDSAHASVQLLADRDRASGDEYIDLGEGDDLWFTTGVNLREETLGDNWFESLSGLAHTQQLLSGTKSYRPGLFFFFWSGLIPDQVHYNGRLDGVPDGARYTVSLLRDAEQEALESTVVMPRSFRLVSPASDQSLSRSSDPVHIEWLPAEGEVRVEVDVTITCADGAEYRYRRPMDEDLGVLQLEAGEIDSDRLSGACSTTLTLSKARLGQLDSTYAGGSISARQVRVVSFTTVD